MSISHLGEPLDAGPPTNTNRSSERTDKIVRGEIRDAYRASRFRSDKINIGKMMKIPLPEYSGGESIDSFIKFLREILLYLVNYNVMGPDDDASRVGILGSTLKDRALKWYQHTIHLNADGSWTFEMAMIELKRYFVKEASSRDAATKFDHLEQGSRTVMELHKDLERLSQQMERSSVKMNSKPNIKKPGFSPKPNTTKAPQTGARDNKISGSTSKQIECFHCKQKGHYSNACPKKNSRFKRAANVETVDEENDEAIANAAEETFSNSQHDDATSGDEEKEERSEE